MDLATSGAALSSRTALPEAFQTARLRAERLDEQHLADVARMNADPRVMGWLGGAGTEAETLVWLRDRVGEMWRRQRMGLYALFATDAADAFVGRAGLRRVEIEGVDEIELLYALTAESWGRGYATEIGAALVALAFARLEAPSVIAYTMPHNVRSRHVMEKLGFVYERDLVHHDLPHVLYRLVRPDASMTTNATPEDAQ
jgi:ribosomal-protein-alanine N-acetyltransferase